jgi:hypothetical protein
MALAIDRVQDEESAALLEQVHSQAMRISIRDAAESLHKLLTGRMAAYVTGVKDAKTVTRWANGEVTDIRVESESRLRAAYEIMTLLLRFDSPETVRAWFLGMNPHLADTSPAEVIHNGRFQDAMVAARSFAAYGANYG